MNPLQKLPTVLHAVFHSFLPAAGVLTTTISKTMAANFEKNHSAWQVAAKNYQFKIIDPKKAKEEFIELYILLQKTNAVLLKKFPTLKCKSKDPLQLSREIFAGLIVHPEQQLNVVDLVEKILKTKEINPNAQALITVLKVWLIDFMMDIWVKLGDKYFEIFEFYLEHYPIKGPNMSVGLISYCMMHYKINHLKSVLKKYAYTDDNVRFAVLMIKHSQEKDKKMAKSILKLLFDKAPKGKKGHVNAVIRKEKVKNRGKDEFIACKHILNNMASQYLGSNCFNMLIEE